MGVDGDANVATDSARGAYPLAHFLRRELCHTIFWLCSWAW